MSEEHEYEIKVNGTDHSVPTDVVTYEQVVKLGFPGNQIDPNVLYHVTFEHAEKPKTGMLSAGESVIVKKHNTEFDVTPTVRS